MGTKTIAVSEETHRHLARLAAESGGTKGALVDEAVLLLERERFWKQWRRDWQGLERDPQSTAAFEAETDALDVLAGDALSDEGEDWSHLPPPVEAGGDEEASAA